MMSENKKVSGAELNAAPVFISKIDELHQKACEQKQDFYTDPDSGYVVMTSFFLQKRAYCCENQCRHCPYTK